MFLSLGSHPSIPTPVGRSRPCFQRRGHPWVHPFFAMDVDATPPTPQNSQENVELEESLNELLTNPMRFISAIASAAAASTPNHTHNQETPCRKRKEAETPATTIVAEKKSRFEVKLNVEGYQPSEMNIKLIENTLTISGSHEQTDESGSVTRNFTRKWVIPDNVVLEELACNFNSKDNTMMISAPWKVQLPPVTEKVIPINVEVDNKTTQPPASSSSSPGDNNGTEKVAENTPTVGA